MNNEGMEFFEFPTQFYSGRVFANPGDPVHVLYSPVFNDDGSMDLKPSGTEDIPSIIDSHRQSVDIHVLLKQYSETGDLNVFNRKKPQFGDFTAVPKTYAEMLQMVMDAKALFESLPVEQRAKFNHDPNEFVAQFGTAAWSEKLGLDADPGVVPPAQSEVIQEKGDASSES